MAKNRMSLETEYASNLLQLGHLYFLNESPPIGAPLDLKIAADLVQVIAGTFIQYFITFCSLPEVARETCDVISGTALEDVGHDVLIKFGSSRSNDCQLIRGVHFVSNSERRIVRAVT